MAWASCTAASTLTMRAAPLIEWAARIEGSICCGLAGSASSRAAPGSAGGVEAHLLPEQIHQREIVGVAHRILARRTSKRRAIVQEADRHGRDRRKRRGSSAPTDRASVAGTRSVRLARSDAPDRPHRPGKTHRSASRSTTSRLACSRRSGQPRLASIRSWSGCRAEQASQVDAQVQFAADVDQPGEQAGPVGHAVDRRGLVTSSSTPHAQRQPFLAEPEDEHALQVGRRLLDRRGQPLGPLREVACRRAASRKRRPARRTPGSCGNGRPSASSGQDRSPQTPIRFQQSACVMRARCTESRLTSGVLPARAGAAAVRPGCGPPVPGEQHQVRQRLAGSGSRYRALAEAPGAASRSCRAWWMTPMRLYNAADGPVLRRA